jgi:hypothetical protein
MAKRKRETRIARRKGETDLDLLGRLTIAYVEKSDLTGCWNWRGKIGKAGYGHIKIGGKDLLVHRFFCRTLNGEIPEDFQVDHLCGNRTCVAPAHLEAVTHTENWLRSDSAIRRQLDQVVCLHGHPLSGVNLYVDKRGHRDCRECRRRRSAEWNARRISA